MEDSDLERLSESLRQLHASLRDRMRERWRRSLPFEDLLLDRWERATYLGFGKETSIYQQSYVYGDVRVGGHTWIGPMTILDGSGGLTIGDYCSIASGVQIYTHDTVKWALTRGKAKYEYAAVHIGNCCHIGALAVITKGVTVGDHCVVAAHSLVNRAVPPFTMVAGAPARPIARIALADDDEVRLLPVAGSERSEA